MKNAWLLRPAPRPDARARLFCFPHAGGGGNSFRLWPAGLPAGLELLAAQLPGRETRLREPPLGSIPEMVEGLVRAMSPHLDVPFALFGHSMGAVVAAEVARALHSGGGPTPSQLIVSARRPPWLPDPEPPLHPLPDREFVVEIQRRYGGMPAEVTQHADLMELLLPALRADIQALETHRPGPRPPLACPVSAFGGADDRNVPREHLDAWRTETRDTFRVRVFAGGHFYLDPRRAEVLADLSATLAPLLAGRAAGQATA
jgi:medium-chain acyl-[acyl-carrier-protein] hydrolase